MAFSSSRQDGALPLVRLALERQQGLPSWHRNPRGRRAEEQIRQWHFGHHMRSHRDRGVRPWVSRMIGHGGECRAIPPCENQHSRRFAEARGRHFVPPVVCLADSVTSGKRECVQCTESRRSLRLALDSPGDRSEGRRHCLEHLSPIDGLHESARIGRHAELT